MKISKQNKQDLIRAFYNFLYVFNKYLNQNGIETLDKDIWLTSKNGKHYKLDEETKEIKIGLGDLNGKKLEKKKPINENIIDNNVKNFINNANLNEKFEIGKVSQKLINDLKKDGFNEDITNYTHNIDILGIRHIKNIHGDKDKEEQIEQVAIIDDDIAKIPYIIKNYDLVKYTGKNKMGLSSIRYKKIMSDGTIFYVEEVRTRKKTLTSKTMYKKKPKR